MRRMGWEGTWLELGWHGAGKEEGQMKDDVIRSI